MHLYIMLAAVGLATGLRIARFRPMGSWTERWHRALFLFLLPPLLLCQTGLAVLWMGPQGEMLGCQAGWWGYGLALGGLAWAGILWLMLVTSAWQSVQEVRRCQLMRVRSFVVAADPPQTPPCKRGGFWKPPASFPPFRRGVRGDGVWGDPTTGKAHERSTGFDHTQLMEGRTARILERPVLFCAQIGFWQPELVVSEGLLQTLTPEGLDAVFAHEQAHYYYRDTFWFFWLGWLRRLTAWLPQTEALWQELLLLRELRADRWAAQKVDPLLLAETLLLVASHGAIASEDICAAFGCAAPRNRLLERIDALLEPVDTAPQAGSWSWSWVLLSLLPLVMVPFHR